MTKYEQLLNNYDDALFALLMEKAIQDKGKSLLEENERLKNDPESAFPANLDKKSIGTISKAFRKERMGRACRCTWYLVRQASVVLLAAVLLFTTAFAASETVRVKTLNLVLDTFSDHMELGFIKKEPVRDTLDFEVGWLPDGFELTDKSDDGQDVRKKYENSNGEEIWIALYLTGANGVFAADTEDAVIDHIQINGIDVVLIVKDYIHIVMPIKERGLIISISSESAQITVNDLIEVAENIKLV